MEYTDAFVAFCKGNLDLNGEHYSAPYESLPACLIDCIYSLQSKYFSVTVPVVERYAERFMQGDRFAAGDTLRSFVEQVDGAGGAVAFASAVLRNRQRLSGRSKAEVCYDLAKKLLSLGINTKEDFQARTDVEVLEAVIRSVRGVGSAAMNYLFMLAGDPDRCKPDVHIHHCVRDALGRDLSDDDCQRLLASAVSELKAEYPHLYVARLDSIIWQKYQIGNKKK
ncbi:MAG: hypothetical protein IJT69_00725 [Clostridia bacterium]|nr:hypothetical protein [Clostridia bacterium]